MGAFFDAGAAMVASLGTVRGSLLPIATQSSAQAEARRTRWKHLVRVEARLRVHVQREADVLVAEQVGRLPVRLVAVAAEARECAPQTVERDVPDRQDAELRELQLPAEIVRGDMIGPPGRPPFEGIGAFRRCLTSTGDSAAVPAL
jgi:hypothetical protein